MQKVSTGIAIFGSPFPEVNDNPFSQGQLKQAQLDDGKLEQKILSIEKLILLFVGKIDDHHWKYTGRSQYPKLVTQRLQKDKEKT